MKNFFIFAEALNYIEDNLCNPITQEEIAAACFCSLSTLQKIWKYCAHTSLKHYISRRRLTLCAKEISQGGSSITEIAMKYQYNSPEVFTRAFTKVWGVAPSKFNESWNFTGIFPRIIPDENNVGGNYMGRKVDISELYDELRSKAGTYVLCFDVKELMAINDISNEAGDKVILEALKRIDTVAGDEMMMFRIGGDEFAMITGTDSKAEVEAIAAKIISQNGNPIEWNGHSIPVSVRVGAMKYPLKGFRYADLFARLKDTIDASCNTDGINYLDD